MLWRRVGHHLRFDGNLHKAGGPAALKAAATFAGVVVRGDMQHVLARLAERDVSRCLPAEGRGTASRRRRLLDLRLRLIERHRPDEYPELPARKEMRRLPQIGPTRLEPVVGPYGNVELLLGVAIEIANQKTAAAVLVGEPAFERAGDARAELLTRLGDLLGRQ